ncbi:NUDIX domain-containing protein [Streptomyces sp. NPDC058613]|uniref:NUDIX hydrolase n=1 Tax=Streptomyces sp. NPDC058613 TaxID=3346556 RepID=UPI00364CFA18
MIHDAFDQRVVEAAASDVRLAKVEFDGAGQWLTTARQWPSEPLAAEVWVFDEDLARVLLVHHRWRGLVPPGGRVEPGETPREGARRELFEETGVEAELLPEPASATVRSYRREWPATLGLSFVAIVSAGTPLVTESGQPAAWTSLNEDWASYFPEDASRVRQHAQWLREQVNPPGPFDGFPTSGPAACRVRGHATRPEPSPAQARRGDMPLTRGGEKSGDVTGE